MSLDIDNLTAGYALNDLVGERVMGWVKQARDFNIPPDDRRDNPRDNPPGWFKHGQRLCGAQYWFPSTSIMHAWQAAAAVSAISYWKRTVVETNHGGPAVCRFQFSHPEDLDWCIEASGNTPELAICRAALKAVTP